MAGLTSTGFEIKTQPELESEISDGIKANVSPQIKTTSDTVVGQMVKLVSERIAALWDLGQAIYDAMYPSSAIGFSLSNVASITGTTRRPATKTRVVATVNIDPGTYAAGTLIAHLTDQPQIRFINIEDAVNSGGSAANVDIIFEAEDPGPTVVAPGALSEIAEIVPGWHSIVNAAEETSRGRFEETDEELRIRREQELSAVGSTTAAAIASDIRQNVPGVISVRVLQNDTDVTDANGLPPHSIEAIVLGPEPPTAADNKALAEQIAASKADGIQAYGASSEVVVDSEGNEITIGYTRPAKVDIEVEVEIAVDPDTYAGDAAVKEAIQAYIDGLGPGADVIYARVFCAPLDVEGVLDVSAANTNIGLLGGALSNSNIPINIRQVARVNLANIQVTVI